MNFTFTDAIVVALISAAITLTVRLLDGFAARRRWPTEKAASEADSAVKVTGAAAAFVDDMRMQIAELRVRIKELEAVDRENTLTIRVQEQRIDQLIADIMGEQAQKRKLEIEVKRLTSRDAEKSKQLRKLWQIIKDAGLEEQVEGNGAPA